MNIPYSTQCIDEVDIQNIIHALKSPFLTQGEINEEFEEKLATFLGVKYVLSFNSATSALYAAYKSCFASKDCVITTPISFVATANMLLACDCRPKFVDIAYNGNISPKKILESLDSSVKGIVSVDYGGNSVDVESIQKIAKEHNLVFISDSSHAFGGSVDGIKIGNFADATIFSFHAIKPITTAEGGALATNDKEIFESATLIRSHGLIKKKLWNSEVKQIGFNFRMNEIQAALGLSQLQKIDIFLQKREEIARFYDVYFKDNPYFTTLHSQIPAHHFSTNHLYPILLHQEFYCAKENIFEALNQAGIGIQVHYKPIVEYELYKGFDTGSLSVAKDFYLAELSIPCHQGMDINQAKYCADTLLKILEKSARLYC